MIADEMQKRLAVRETASETQRMTVTARVRLFDEVESIRVVPRGLSVSVLISGDNDQTNIFHAGAHDLLQNDPEGFFLYAIAIHERLQGEGPLAAGCRGDDRFFDVHFRLPGKEEPHAKPQSRKDE